MKRISLIILFQFICLVGLLCPMGQMPTLFSLQAQELVVENCELNPDNHYALEHPRQWNDEPCGVVIIKTPNIEGITFPSRKQYVGDISYQNGCYYVYLPQGAYTIAMQHKDFQPLNIDMKEDYGIRVKGSKTYEITLKKNLTVHAINQATISFKITPIVKGTIICDGDEKEIPADGKIEFTHALGEASYQVKAENYQSEAGKISISQAAVAKNIHLRPVTVGVEVGCNVSDAKVYVDNIDYGEVGKLQIPLGEHEIRLQADGYIDETKEVTFTRETSYLNFRLQKNENRIEIHPTPIRIYCYSNKLYKNNKEIEGWKSGNVVLFMPGVKCLLSDDDDNSCWFRAGKEPKSYDFSGGILRERPATKK